MGSDVETANSVILKRPDLGQKVKQAKGRIAHENGGAFLVDQGQQRIDHLIWQRKIRVKKAGSQTGDPRRTEIRVQQVALLLIGLDQR